MTEFIEPVMKWIVAPVVAVVLWLARKIQQNEAQQSKLDTELKILEAKMEAQTIASNNNHGALRATMDEILKRIDSMEVYLRKGGGND